MLEVVHETQKKIKEVQPKFYLISRLTSKYIQDRLSKVCVGQAVCFLLPGCHRFLLRQQQGVNEVADIFFDKKPTIRAVVILECILERLYA